MKRSLVALLLISMVATGWAQEDIKDRARALAVEGQRLYEEGKYAEAAAKFAEAQAVFPHPNNLFNEAKAWEKAAEYQKAIDAYKAYLELFEKQNGRPAPEAADVERTIAVLKEKAYLALPEVTIDSDPPGALVSLDDPTVVSGQTPLVTHLAEGTHKVYLRKEGYQYLEKEFIVRSREPMRLTFALEKVRNIGGLRFIVNVRGARIYVDGKVVAATPYYETFQVEAGRHQVMIEKDLYEPVTKNVDVVTGETTDVTADLHLKKAPFSWRGYVGITAAVLGAAGVAVAGTVLRDRANEEWRGTPTYEDFKKWTYVGYGVGFGLIGAGAGLLIWEFARTAVFEEDLITSNYTPILSVDGEGNAFVSFTARY